MRTTHWINAALIAALFIGSALGWPLLPDRIPAHFDAGGDVDRWTETSLGSWFSLPLVALGVAGLNYLIAACIPRWPKLVNIPDKKQFLELSPERQAPVLALLQDLVFGMSAPLIVIFGMLQWMTYRTALGADSQGYLLAVLLPTLLMTPLILIVWMPKINREVRKQLREYRGAATR